MRLLIVCVFSLVSTLTFAQPSLVLEEYASGFTEPVDIANAGDERLFIVERSGYIRIVDVDGETLPVEYLDIHDLIEDGYNEQGLLGLAFHPDYATNGYFFVYYTDVDGNTVVSRFKKSTFDDNVADPTTEEIIYTASQPFVNHNGGCIKFGADGYLYIGLGDGGSAGDPGNRAQNPELALGKMLRIDVDGELPFEIPADNPFVGATDTLPEIWAIGYRNPWRWSFDRLTQDMWIGDVGQNLKEEIDFEPAGSPGGLNYGWRCYEAFAEFNDAGCDGEDAYQFPIMDYPHNMSTGGFAVTGGFVYRGTQFPGMYGYYLCADFVSGNWWWIHDNGIGGFDNQRIDDLQLDISGFGEDAFGEMYCCEFYSGQIFHITDACGDFVVDATASDFICGVQDAEIDLTITDGESPFSIEWSTGDTDEDITVDAAGYYTVTVTDDAGCERNIFVVVNETPAFVASVDYDEIANSLSTDDGISWQWYLNGVLIDGATAMTYTPVENGIYSVEVTDANGCSVMSEEISVDGVAISQYDLFSSVQIFPNPVGDVMQIEIQSAMETGNVMISIFDISGKELLSENITVSNGSNMIEINVEEIPQGIYLLQLTNHESSYNVNFIK